MTYTVSDDYKATRFEREITIGTWIYTILFVVAIVFYFNAWSNNFADILFTLSWLSATAILMLSYTRTQVRNTAVAATFLSIILIFIFCRENQISILFSFGKLAAIFVLAGALLLLLRHTSFGDLDWRDKSTLKQWLCIGTLSLAFFLACSLPFLDVSSRVKSYRDAIVEVLIAFCAVFFSALLEKKERGRKSKRHQ